MTSRRSRPLDQALDGYGWIDRLHDRSPFPTVFNVAGTPAMSVPVTADTGTGLPLGMGRTPAVWAGPSQLAAPTLRQRG
ncbi:hypothetical protein SALBM135S_04901 [Streptomyces alboniger]